MFDVHSDDSALDVRRSPIDVQGVRKQMTNDLTAQEVRLLLKLEPHATCGFVRVTFISKQRIAPGGLPPPFVDGRPAGSALYFMVTPDAPVRLHRIRNDQFYDYYLGDPIEVLTLHENGVAEHCCSRSRPARRPTRSAFDSRKYISYCTRYRAPALVSWREHRMARRRTS